MTDAELRAHIASMTMAERQWLVEKCEEEWRGTPWWPMAVQLREQFEALKRTLH